MDIDYRPRQPKSYRPKIGLIGCGGITRHHLTAYRAMGLDVVAMADINLDAARQRRDEFYQQAEVYTDPHILLDRNDIEVVDVATHVDVRVPLLRAALEAGKHVLSQKPFTLDLDEGRRLADLADAKGVRIAVNQNGRWAPYFAWLLQAVWAGVLGEMHTLDLVMNWNHTGLKGMAFEKIHHIILYDFAIHWFDIAANVFHDRKVRRVFASANDVPCQNLKPPMIASTIIEFEHGLATLSFSGHSMYGSEESIKAVGSKGAVRGRGRVCNVNPLHLFNAHGESVIELEGAWFPDGFRGTMGELLCAIEEGREPSNSARNNLHSLEICFAAMTSADTHQPQMPGNVPRVTIGETV